MSSAWRLLRVRWPRRPLLALGVCVAGKLALAPRGGCAIRGGVRCLAGVSTPRSANLQGRGSAVHGCTTMAAGGVHLLACATEYRQETAILQRSANRNGIGFHAVGVGVPWGGFATKFLSYEQALRDLIGRGVIRPDDLVLLMDAWDTVVLGSKDELLEKIADLPRDTVLCGSERVCGPNHFLVGQMERLYPDGRTPWRYPNSGGLVASAEAMHGLLRSLIHDTEDGATLEASENDQVRLHDFLLARAARGDPFPLRLDVDCRVFQCMYEEQPQWDVTNLNGAPRIINRLTKESPVIAHGNGHTGRWFLSSLFSEMRLLEHLGLTMDELAHLPHEMPVAPGTVVTEEVKEKYCPWWYMPGVHKGATDGFGTFYMIRSMQCGGNDDTMGAAR